MSLSRIPCFLSSYASYLFLTVTVPLLDILTVSRDTVRYVVEYPSVGAVCLMIKSASWILDRGTQILHDLFGFLMVKFSVSPHFCSLFERKSLHQGAVLAGKSQWAELALGRGVGLRLLQDRLGILQQELFSLSLVYSFNADAGMDSGICTLLPGDNSILLYFAAHTLPSLGTATLTWLRAHPRLLSVCCFVLCSISLLWGIQEAPKTSCTFPWIYPWFLTDSY